ncbi:TRAP transporter small permease [Geminicoccaceae bacterium 1502E]|nr:TRAP transporter small permease [Geminicoccaceae bacterium 1502E]
MRLSQSLPAALDRALAMVRPVSRAVVVGGGAMMLLSALMIAADVLLRRLLGVSTWGADELSYYALAISTSWALAFSMLDKAHIRISVLTGMLGPRLRAACDIVALLAMGFFALMACEAIFGLLERSWQRGATSITTLQTPLWIPQGLFLLGFVFFALVLALLLLRVLAALLLERSFETAELHGGAPTIESETRAAVEEAAALGRGTR